MITAVDTNILIDVFNADPKFGQCSSQTLRTCLNEGALQACEVVWVEIAGLFPHEHECTNAMRILNIEFSSIDQKTALAAAKAWRLYRKSGGTRERVVADFLIGAHAHIQCNRLLTRDRGFYRHYFHGLTVLDPSTFL